MQTVILAAGRGKRLVPYTDTIPKPLVPVSGTPILHRVLSSLPEEISEIILVVGYKADEIKVSCGSSWKGIPITYVTEAEQKGTFHALKAAEKHLKGKFLVLNADSLYDPADLEEMVKYDSSVLVRREKGPSEHFGISVIENGLLKEIIEKQAGLEFTFANCGAYVLSSQIFSESVIRGQSGEEWLSSMVGALSKKIPIYVVEAREYYTFTTVEDIVHYESKS